MKQLLLSFVSIVILMLISLACAIFLFCFMGEDGCNLEIIQDAEVGIVTLLGYIVSLPLLWLGWRLTTRTKDRIIQVVLRSGLIASAFAPSVISDPGGAFVFVVPAWVPTVAYAFFPPAALAAGGLPISVAWLVLLFVASAEL